MNTYFLEHLLTVDSEHSRIGMRTIFVHEIDTSSTFFSKSYSVSQQNYKNK